MSKYLNKASVNNNVIRDGAGEITFFWTLAGTACDPCLFRVDLFAIASVLLCSENRMRYMFE